MLKIERDKVYIDGRGQQYRVVCVDGGAYFPVIAVNDNGDVYTFTSEGAFYTRADTELDLVREVKEKQVRYVNIYPTHVSPYVCKLDAEDCAGTGRLACIRVEYEEDQFDD
jgi:hypothetical protein